MVQEWPKKSRVGKLFVFQDMKTRAECCLVGWVYPKTQIFVWPERILRIVCQAIFRS